MAVATAPATRPEDTQQQQQQCSLWFDLVDAGCGLLDDSCVARQPAKAPVAATTRNLQVVDYAALHDSLLESLLAEQRRQSAVEPSRKRRRPRKQQRVTPLTQKSPSHYLHLHVRLQKDKGQGCAAGAQICAKGRDATLSKLRAKMALLASQPQATMAVQPARVALRKCNLVETRSIVSLKMGFLSLQYGLLVRWDSQHTGKASLVVLRKMCPDAFYPLRSVPPVVPPEPTRRFGVHSVAGLPRRPFMSIVLQTPAGMENVPLVPEADRYVPAAAVTIAAGSTLEVKILERRRRRYALTLSPARAGRVVLGDGVVVELMEEAVEPPPVVTVPDADKENVDEEDYWWASTWDWFLCGC